MANASLLQLYSMGIFTLSAIRYRLCYAIQKRVSKQGSKSHLKASMTTLPFTDWIGSTTTATAL